jgi:hypothetical protein
MPTKEADEEEVVAEVPNVVMFQRGEDRTPMDISANANAADVKKAYALTKGIPPDSIQLIVQGRLLNIREGAVIPGVPTYLEKDVTLVRGTSVTVVNARLSQGARRTYRRRPKKQRKTNKMSSKYKNVR